ncbi:acyl-CoA dehydrogenase family protein [Actinomadura opuntiae]|uniref:acyl-CoA dehydrogenase family protein n=1 Tax=Actinomadura sp. OS1-43 TaxID=604315 RepID=UPI00255A73E7|nr:acyl-CoA dehydrogenase family protein [Actinomadura sp. OS1-43]MDL4816440.1 acyl-CoA dehydrogenase family protein [Actinomadura sp. OS1-43]
MTPEFSDVHDELRAVARDLLGGTGTGTGTGPGRAVGWKAIIESGWPGLEVPEALDGAGATFAEVAVVLEEMGRAAACIPYFGAAVLGVGALKLLQAGPGTDALLRGTASGAAVPAVALPGDTGTAEPAFRLERSPHGLALHGDAAFVPDAVEADRLLLPALAPDGEPVMVDAAPGTVGIQVTAQPLLDATRRFGRVTAAGAVMAEDSMRRFAGDPAAALRRLHDRAAVAVACDSLGLSEAMLDATVAYAGVREQFGRPIGSFQAVKHACADMFVQVTVARRLVDAAARALSSDDRATVSMAKSYACEAAVDVAGKAMQLHGGMGYTWESGVHAYLKRAMLNRSLFGSPTEHRRRLARRYR